MESDVISMAGISGSMTPRNVVRLQYMAVAELFDGHPGGSEHVAVSYSNAC